MGHTESDDGDLYHGKDHSDSVSADDCSSGSPPGGRILKKGPWTAAEDALLVDYVKKHGDGNWNAVQKHSGLFRCGKSCRLRWANHLRPNLKKGAFTHEEERPIVELHARMGNKWARMATQFPGRTDNEIKNYWNTRIKRQQRNGLPLYPPEMNLQASNENQQSPNGCEFELDCGHHDLLHLHGFDVPPIMVDGIKAAHRSSPYAIQFSEIPTEGILSRCFESSQDNTFLGPSVHRAKRVCDYSSSFTSINGVTSLFQHDLSLNHLENDSFEKVSWPFSLSTLYDPDQNKRGAPPPQTMISGSHTLKNGDFSASNPLREVVKSELPSFQYFDCNLDSSILPPLSLETVDSHIQSPPRIAVRSDCMPPHSNGLLQDLIPEYHALSGSKHRSCESSTHSSVVPGEPIEYYAGSAWPEIIESLPPIIYTVSSECNPLASYPVIAPSTVDGVHGSRVKLERVDHISDPNTERQAAIEDLIMKSDGSLSWFDERPESLKIRFSGADPINCLGGDNFPNIHKQQNLDTSTPNESWGLGAISWCLPNV